VGSMSAKLAPAGSATLEIDRRVDAGGRPVYAMARLADDWRAGRTTSTGDGLDDLRLSADCP
jgi:hypothetical protein